MKDIPAPRVVVIGGGTGSSTLLRALRNYCSDLIALVNMSDDGGSTGSLRQDYSVLPAGDIRQCLTALANQDELRELFDFRFEDGSLRGHAFGNIFLAALQMVTGSFPRAVAIASEVLQISGAVAPVTLDDVTLCMSGPDGTVIRSEVEVGHSRFASPRPTLWLDPDGKISPAAREAILGADMVVISPGNLYGSLAPALIVKGVREALNSTSAKCVYVCNLATNVGQTDGFDVQDFADEIERLAGGPFLQYVLFNDAALPPEQAALLGEGEQLVVPGRLHRRRHYELVGADLLGAPTDVTASARGDELAALRSYLLHDPAITAAELMKILLG